VSIGDAAIEALRRGETLPGYFALSGSTDELPGFVRWSHAEGASVELIGDTRGWPRIGHPWFVVHGRLRDGGDVSLLDAWVKHATPTNEATSVSASTLALGDHVDPGMSWSQVIYSTANLSEWRRDTGLSHKLPAPRTGPARFRVDWRPPPRDQVRVPGGALIFYGTRDFSVAYSADWKISTFQELAVRLDTPMTPAEAYRDFAIPLVSLTSFVSDRPDGIVHEAFVDQHGRRRFEVWRQGPVGEPRDWRATDGYLCHADDLADYASAIRTWWDLELQLRPALGLFADHINHGFTFSPARFLTLYTAVETYARERHGRNDWRALRDYAGVPETVTGCNNAALAVIGASRLYFAHLGLPPNGPTIAHIEANALLSTRRASALMQACLLRELEFSPSETERLLRAHYANWPLT
jgi:hypothetical protein